ncbi:MAG: Rho termination factor N-terminal domain-containing protein, partial [Microcystaceae cyanobacterium]
MAQDSLPLEEMTLRQLRKVASEYNIPRYSRMRKAELITAIQGAMGMEEQNIVQPSPSEPLTDIPEDSATIPPSPKQPQEEQKVEASKFELGQEDQLGDSLASVDEGLGELPSGYGD